MLGWGGRERESALFQERAVTAGVCGEEGQRVSRLVDAGAACMCCGPGSKRVSRLGACVAHCSDGRVCGLDRRGDRSAGRRRSVWNRAARQEAI